MIDVQSVSKQFGTGEAAVRALDNVSLAVRENEFFTLLGPSGCGKTTLLRLIAGFEHPSAGRIFLHGEDISSLPPYRRPVNTVFQSYALFPHMTVAKNVGFGLKMLGKPKAQIAATVDQMLRMVKMEDLKHRRTAQLSGGQQQRVALARALAPRPQVLLLDEPLSALDLKLRKEMRSELKRLQHETGVTFIFVTHDQEEALTMSDRIAVMNLGRVLQVGSPRAVYDHPAQRFVADFIGETNFLSAELVAMTGANARVRLPSGKTLTASVPAQIRAELAGRQSVSVAVRPEHADIIADSNGAALRGRLANVVYFGTDTHYHIELPGGEAFIVRRQNSRSGQAGFEPGGEVGINLDDAAVQVLAD